MKKIITLLAIMASTIAFSQVGIGTNTPSSKSILDLTSTDKGFLLPRMTTSERTGIAPNATTEKGMQVFDTTTNTIWYWNGATWVEGGSSSGTYTGSTSVALNGSSFERAALTGDVTAAANSNATVIVANAVTSAKILDETITSSDILNGTILTADIADNAITSAKILDESITSADILNGTIATVDMADNAITSAKIVDGTVALADLASNSVNSAKIVDGTIVAADLNQMSATSGQVLKWNGTAWAPAADTDTNTTYTGSTSVALNGTSFERAALTGDVTAAANSNATVIAADAVTSAKILDASIANTDLAAGSGGIYKGSGSLPTGTTIYSKIDNSASCLV